MSIDRWPLILFENTLKTIEGFCRSCSRNIKTARVRLCSLEWTLFTLDHLQLWTNDWLSWETTFEIRGKLALIYILMVFLNEYCYFWQPLLLRTELNTMARLPRTRHLQTRLDQAVFKLNGIVALVHQLPNLKRILFKKRPIFHLPYAECCKVTWIFNNCHCWKRTSYQKSSNFAVFQLGRDSPYTS